MASLIKSGSNGSKLKLKEYAEVVVIGGGIAGASIAYHLAKQGMKDVVLLDKSELTPRTTWHSAGGITSYHGNIGTEQIHYYSLLLYSLLAKETGQDINFHRPGSVCLASSQESMDGFKAEVEKQGWDKTPMKVLTPDEIHKMCPLMNMENVYGGLYTPVDGHLDAYSLAQALNVGAGKYGAEVYRSVSVTGVKQRADGRWEVTTPHGTINAKRVVNAAGVWARDVGLLSGIDLPLMPVNHQYIITANTPGALPKTGEIPVVKDADGSFYLRQDKNGVLFVVNDGPEKLRIQEDWWNGVPSAVNTNLFESDLDRLTDIVAKAKERFPVLKNVDICSVAADPIAYAPDLAPLVGPYPEHYNYWVAAGFGYGISHGGGVGKFMAEWIINEEPTYDLIGLDPSRFCGHWTTKKYVIDKIRESYGAEVVAQKPMRETACYKYTKKAGCQYGTSTGWEVPYSFGTPEQEYDWGLNKVGIIDFSEFGKFEVKGKDAEAFVDKMVANKIPALGTLNVSHMLTPQGGVYSELTVTHAAPNHFLLVTGDACEYHDLRWLLDHSRDYKDVQITNRTNELVCLSIAGPKARDVLKKLTTEDVSTKSFRFMHCRNMVVAGISLLCLRVTYSGELGWEFFTKSEEAPKLYEALLEAGQEFGIGHIGLIAVNAMRLEKGFRFWGAEMNVDTNPYQAGLDVFVKIKKEANFIGKEALVKIKAGLLESRLVFMTVEGEAPAGGETIWFNGKVVGNCTSGSYGYQVKKNLVFGYLPMYLQDIGTEVEIDIGGKRYIGTVAQAPLVHMEPQRERMAARQKK